MKNKTEEQERQDIADKLHQWAQVGSDLRKKAYRLGLKAEVRTYISDNPEVSVNVFEETKNEY